MVLMTHNTDIADSWEREGEDPSYFYAFSPRGYAFGINAVLYAQHTEPRTQCLGFTGPVSYRGNRPTRSAPSERSGDETAPAPPPAVARPSVCRSALESASLLSGVTLSGSNRIIR